MGWASAVTNVQIGALRYDGTYCSPSDRRVIVTDPEGAISDGVGA